MGKLATQVIADRAARDAAKAVFDHHYGAFKADLEERGVGGRIADEAMEQAKDLFDEAVTVAQAHPGVIGGTIAVLALWLLRNPLFAWVEKLAGPIADKLKELDSGKD
jgi:hypothetical protein